MKSNLPKKFIIGVMAVPINKKREFLLTKRNAPKTSVWHNKWQIAGGGVEFGETPEQALAREMEEELKVSFRILHPYPVVKSIVWYGEETSRKHDAHIHFSAFVVDIGNQEIDISGDDETNDFGWFGLEDALGLDSLPATSEIVREAHQMCNKYSLWDMLQ